jgi:hypothetical protein
MIEFVYNNNEYAVIKMSLFYVFHEDHLSFIIYNKTSDVKFINAVTTVYINKI